MSKTPVRRKPTQGDVARLANVSQATVSYVLSQNSSVQIPAVTRARVLEAVQELHYVPNYAARTLRTRRTMTLACILPDITNPFYPWFERGIQDMVDANGYCLITYNTDGDSAKEHRALQSVREGRVDGIVAMAFHLRAPDFAALVDAGISVVALSRFNRDFMAAGIDSLSIDNVAAACAAVEHLIGLGHRRIAMIAGLAGTFPQEKRATGFTQALAAHGLNAEERLVRGGQFTEEGGYLATIELLRQDPVPTAIFAANDLMAIGALRAIRESGARVPDDIAVIGFDDIPAAAMVSPSLSTIAQHPQSLGSAAAHLLLERLKGETVGPGRHCDMPFTLVARASTGASGDRERGGDL